MLNLAEKDALAEVFAEQSRQTIKDLKAKNVRLTQKNNQLRQKIKQKEGSL